MACFPDIWAPAALSCFTASISLILVFVIISGNLSIILAVFKDPLRKLRTPFSYFLVNLATSDLLVGCVTMPVSFVIHLQEPSGFLDIHFVRTIHLSYFISATASVLSLGALCLDRYLAITWPIKYRRSLRLSRCGLISLCIWIFSLTLPMIYIKVGYIVYLMVFSHISVLVTFCILLLSYRQVYKSLRKQANEMKATQRTISSAAAKEDLRKVASEKKVTRAFLIILLLFICTYTPAIIMIYILHFCEQCNCTLRHVLRDLQFLIVTANSAMNPFVCAIRLRAFRQSILVLLRCRGRKVKYLTKYGKDKRGESSVSTSDEKITHDKGNVNLDLNSTQETKVTEVT